MDETAMIVRGPVDVIPAQAETDDRLIELWLHGRPAGTQRGYLADAVRFLTFVGKPLAAVTLAAVQAYTDTLADLAPATRARRINVVKSLFSFAHRLGYVSFDVARAVKTPTVRNRLGERILAEADVQRMLALESHPRNRVLLRLLYAAGVRAAEVCGLRWRDLTEREDGGQIAVFGKGSKTRFIRLPATIWRDLLTLRGDAGADEPVFRSRKGGALSPSQIWRIVKTAASRAGLSAAVSCHWLRHAHASHSLDRGAPIHVVQATLGHANVSTTSRYTHVRPGDSSARYLAV